MYYVVLQGVLWATLNEDWTPLVQEGVVGREWPDVYKLLLDLLWITKLFKTLFMRCTVPAKLENEP